LEPGFWRQMVAPETDAAILPRANGRARSIDRPERACLLCGRAGQGSVLACARAKGQSEGLRKVERGMPLVAFSLIPSASSYGVHTRPHRSSGWAHLIPSSRGPVAPDDEAPGSRQFRQTHPHPELRPGPPGLCRASGYSLRSMDAGTSISIGRMWIRGYRAFFLFFCSKTKTLIRAETFRYSFSFN
jgi:hypothetical protein